MTAKFWMMCWSARELLAVDETAGLSLFCDSLAVLPLFATSLLFLLSSFFFLLSPFLLFLLYSFFYFLLSAFILSFIFYLLSFILYPLSFPSLSPVSLLLFPSFSLVISSS